MKRALLLAVLALAVLLVVGCGATGQATAPGGGASITGASLKKDAPGLELLFSLEASEAGELVRIDVRGAVSRGRLGVVLWDAAGQPVWQVQAGVGPLEINDAVNLPRAGQYKLGLAWDAPVSANYAVRWRLGTPEVSRVSPVALLPGAGMIAIALGFVLYAARRRLGWGYLGLGALAWVVSVACKFLWAIPLNTPIYNALFAALPQPLAGLVFYLYVGSLTGIFEVGLVWLVLRFTRLGRVGWSRALAFGIGFGAVEALLLGLSSSANTLAALLAPAALPLEALAAIARQSGPLLVLAPIVERAAAMFIHILANVLVFYAVARRRPGWFWLAFAFKTAIDSVAAFAQLWGLDTLARIWAIEAVVMAFGVVGFLGLRRLAARYLPEPAPLPQ